MSITKGAEFENQIFIQIKEALQQRELSRTYIVSRVSDLFEQSKVSRSLTSHEPDIIIYKGTYPFILIETNINSNNQIKRQRAQERASFYFESSDAKYYALVDENSYYVIEFANKHEVQTLSLNEFIDLWIRKFTKLDVRQKGKTIAAIILEEKKELLSSLSDVNSEKLNLDILDALLNKKDIEESLAYDDNGNFFHFDGNSFDLKSFENILMQNLLPAFQDKMVCRYTSFESLFTSMQYNSFRMNGIVGMNDRTEVNYVDSYKEKKPRLFAKSHWKTVEIINQRFIISCADKSKVDDLTMWRLYGDNAKGVCLIFKVHPHRQNANLLIRRVSYAQENGYHPQLEFLKNITERIRNEVGENFRFKNLQTWKHFFKPYDYRIEDEIRLLYIQTDNSRVKDWIITFGDNILNPAIAFKLNSLDFPLELDSIIIGPNLPEKDTNKVQLEEYIRNKRSITDSIKTENNQEMQVPRYNIQELSIIHSKINNFRR